MKRRSKSVVRRPATERRAKRRPSNPLKAHYSRFDRWPMPVILSDRRFVPCYWNARARQLFGERQWETIRQHLASMAVILTSRARDTSIVERLMAGSLDPWHEEEMITQDGRQLFCRWSSIPLRTPEGNCIGIVSVAQDITEHRQSETQRLETEKRFKILADHAPVMMWMSSVDGGCAYVNKPWQEFCGVDLEAQQGEGWIRIVHSEDLERLQEVYQSAFVARQTFKLECRMRRSDGEYRWILNNGVPLFDTAGTFTGYIGSCIDITDQRRLMQDTENTAALLRGTLDSTADGILVVDGKGKMLVFNNRFVEMWRLPREIISTRDDNRALAFAKDQLKDPSSFITRVSDMYTHMEEVKCDTIEFKDGRIYERYTIPCVIKGRIVGRVWSFRDITARGRADHAVDAAVPLDPLLSPLFQIH